jgi:hypothetical protein
MLTERNKWRPPAEVDLADERVQKPAFQQDGGDVDTQVIAVDIGLCESCLSESVDEPSPMERQ